MGPTDINVTTVGTESCGACVELPPGMAVNQSEEYHDADGIIPLSDRPGAGIELNEVAYDRSAME